MAPIFVGAFLFFTLQPMVGKSLLPHYGGAAAVWVFCLTFFQLSLVGGYLWAHWMRPYSYRRHVFALFAALGIAQCGTSFYPPTAGSGSLSVFIQLIPLIPVTILLAATTPLLQSSQQGSFRVFSLSNLGCFAALLVYVSLLEPFTNLDEQWIFWKIAVTLLAVALLFRSKNHSELFTPLFFRTSWLLEAGVPCALLAATTSQLTLRLTAIPLVWVIPLICYLLSWVIAFWRPIPTTVLRLWPLATIVGIFTYIIGARFSPALMAFTQLSCLFLISWGLHGQVYASRPQPASLTSFYLNLALGGFAGTLIVAVIAPIIFDVYIEFPLLLCAARLLYRSPSLLDHGDNKQRFRKKAIDIKVELAWLLSFYGIISVIVWAWIPKDMAKFNLMDQWPIIGICCGLALFLRRPARVGLALLCVVQIFVAANYNQNLLYSDRSFYGPIAVQKSGEIHILANGQTIHGRQNFVKEKRQHALGYYHNQSGAGQLFREQGREWKKVLGIGLGSGALAAYLHPEQEMTFYEIDPNIVTIAEDPNLFTYLHDARQRGSKITTLVGDARQLLRDNLQTFDAIFVDAFFGSSIPIHLLTHEALTLYLARLRTGGYLAFHTSHPLLDFARVLKKHASTFGLSFDFIKRPPAGVGTDPSSWVIMRKQTNAHTPSNLTSLRDARISPLLLLR